MLPDDAHWDQLGTVFDLGLLQENLTIAGQPADLYFLQAGAEHVETKLVWRMWNSWRPRGSIGYSTSTDGKAWNQTLEVSLHANAGWEHEINRPFVKKIATGKYGMWYTGQGAAFGNLVGGAIGYAESPDGITFTRTNSKGFIGP